MSESYLNKIENCERSCEYCEYVNRGLDDCCHQVYWISDRCPLDEKSKFYKEITGDILDLAYITRLTGCIHCKPDEIYKKQMEEADEQIRQLHERLRLRDEAIAKH